jgi:phosphopantothenoylcysteine decarboxylase/phosphopantothenate--cysteine ligase
MNLRNKNILITAGPTWVPIDNVRVISNIATGETGILLAKKLMGHGSKVTLVLGGAVNNSLSKKIRLIPFRFFDELSRIIKKEITTENYDIVIHTAAVSDYKPALRYAKKIKSGIKGLKIALKPTPKIIDCIKKIRPGVVLAGFKFAPEEGVKTLLSQARELFERSKLDFVVANNICGNKYTAYILTEHKVTGPFLTKNILAESLVKEIRGYC